MAALPERETVRVTPPRALLQRPIQFWRPSLLATLGLPAVARDAQRGFEAHNGERTVWLLPGCEGTVRWLEEPDNFRSGVVAVPAEHIDRIDVVHIGENGYMVGFGSMYGLLDEFLKATNLDLLAGPEVIPMALPFIDGQKVSYRPARVHCRPGSTMPISSIAKEDGRVQVMTIWPPSGLPVPPVSIDAESDAHYGPLVVADIDGVRVAVSPEDPTFRSGYFVYRWPEAIGRLFPEGGGGADTLYHQARMREVATRSSKDLQGALEEARILSAPYLSLARAPRAEAWFAPLVQEDDADYAVCMGERFGLTDARTYDEACKSEKWAKKMAEPIIVTRAWGPIGLFWALTIDRLEQGQHFHLCRRCGQLVAGDRRKLFCGKADNPTCFNERRAEDRRRSRSRHRLVAPTAPA